MFSVSCIVIGKVIELVDDEKPIMAKDERPSEKTFLVNRFTDYKDVSFTQ